MTEVQSRLNGFNGKSILLKQLCEAAGEMPFTIPDFQRNYKWKLEMAEKLVTDYIEEFNKYKNDKSIRKTLALITLYYDNKNSEDSEKHELLVIDGQQRLITILLILHALGAEDEIKKLKIRFIRDSKLDPKDTREAYIGDIENAPVFPSIARSDKRRLYNNYKSIKAMLQGRPDIDRKELAKLIFENTEFLLQMSDSEPIAEFLNLNLHKTPFSVCDTVRSKLITFYARYKSDFDNDAVLREKIKAVVDEDKDYRENIVRLFEELSGMLYDDEIYNFVKLGVPDEYIPETNHKNRLNIIFKEYAASDYNTNNANESFIKELDEKEGQLKWVLKLFFYRDMLRELKYELNNGIHTSEVLFRNYKEYYGTANNGRIFMQADWKSDEKGKRLGKYGGLSFFEILSRYYDGGGVIEQSEDGKSTGRPERVLRSAYIPEKCDVYRPEKNNISTAYLINSQFDLLLTEPTDANAHHSRGISSIVEDAYKLDVISDEDRERAKKAEEYIALSRREFEDSMQTTGKFFLNKFVHDQRELYMAEIPPSKKEFKFERGTDGDKDAHGINHKSAAGSVTVGEFLDPNSNFVVPGIQRYYCMGSMINDDNGKGDILDALFEAYGKRNESGRFTLSAVTVKENADNTVIYDGQQRIVTLACILKVLEGRSTNIEFKSSRVFDNFFSGFMSADDPVFYCNNTKASDFSAASVCHFVKVLKKRISDKLDRFAFGEFFGFIRDKVCLNKVVISGDLSTAEQYFLEINDGVQLLPYEIFKSRLVDAVMKRCDKDFAREFSHKLDNDWLDVFFSFRESLGLDTTVYLQEQAYEELCEMRMLEFIMRMKYWHEHPAITEYELEQLVPFGNRTSLIGTVAEKLAPNADYAELKKYMDALCDKLPYSVNQRYDNPVRSYGEYYDIGATHPEMAHCWEGVRIFCNLAEKPDMLNPVIKQFVKRLGSMGEEMAYYDGRKTDVVMWGALYYIVNSPDPNLYLKRLCGHYNAQRYCDTQFAYILPCEIAKFPYIPLPIPLYYGDKPKCVSEILKCKKYKNTFKFPSSAFHLYSGLMQKIGPALLDETGYSHSDKTKGYVVFYSTRETEPWTQISFRLISGSTDVVYSRYTSGGIHPYFYYHLIKDNLYYHRLNPLNGNSDMYFKVTYDYLGSITVVDENPTICGVRADYTGWELWHYK